jgi:hypothetical protein
LLYPLNSVTVPVSLPSYPTYAQHILQCCAILLQTEQAKHWEEVKQLKDSEAALLEECDRLTQVHVPAAAALLSVA